ncbi:hypothetical protein KC644_04030 [Candidatus Berkelbacteria bacterium]|nr:hypothetical protein [Candidatus Berkelbacteria bacterium]
MAASINELESIEKIHKGDKVIMQFDSSVSDSFLRKFERYFSRQRLCVLTEKQFNALSNLYSISTTTLSTDNLDVEVVKVKDQDRLSTNFLERIIESSGEDPHCHVLKNNNFFYILFNFDVS